MALLTALAATALSTMPDRAHATDYTWTASKSAGWSVSADWSPSGVPGLGDNVFIGSGGTVTVTSTTREANSVTLGVTGGSYGGYGTLAASSNPVHVDSNLYFGTQGGTNGGLLDISGGPVVIGYTGTGSITDLGSGTATINLRSGGSLVLTGGSISTGINFNFSGGTLQDVGTEASNINLTGTGATVLTTIAQSAFNATLSGNGNLSKTGTGTLTLGGSNSYSGATTIAGGVLSLANSGALAGSGTISFAGGTLQYSGSNQVDYSGQIANSTRAISLNLNGQSVTFGSSLAASCTGGLTELGTGTLTLGGSNSYSGATTIAGGVLRLANSGALAGSGTISFTGGTLQYSSSNQVDYSGLIARSTAAISIDTNGQSVTYNGVLNSTNSGGLTKVGAGTLTLGGSNGYTGPTLVAGGSLTLANTAVLLGSTFDASGSGTLSFGTLTTATFGGLQSSVTVSSLSLNNSSGSAVALSVGNTGGTTTFNGALIGSGSLTQLGGRLTLTGSNTYSGITTISGGTIQLRNGGSLPASSTVAFSSSAAGLAGLTLDIGSGTQSLVNMTFDTGNYNPTYTVTGNGGTLALGGNNFSLVADDNGNKATLAMAGLSNFIYSSSGNSFAVGEGTGDNRHGTLSLAANSSVTASSIVVGEYTLAANGRNNGILNLGPSTTLNADNIVIGEGQSISSVAFQSGLTSPTLTIRNTAGTGRANLTIANYYVGTGLHALYDADATFDLSNGSGTSGSVLNALLNTLSIGSLSISTTQNAAGTFTMAGGTLDATSIVLGQTQAATTGTGLASGTLAVNAGIVTAGSLTIGDNQGTPGTASGTFTLNGGTLNAQTIQPGGGSASRTFNWNNGTIGNYNATTDLTINNGLTLTLAATGTQNFQINGGSLGSVVSAVLTGGGGLGKSGAGSLTLNGSSTYNGSTTVNAGTLKAGAVNAFSGNSAFTINGGTLDATGFAQAVNSLTIGSGGVLNLYVGNLLTSNNAATFGGGTLNISGYTPGTTEKLIVYGSHPNSDTFGTFTVDGSASTGYQLEYDANELDIAPLVTGNNSILAASTSSISLGRMLTGHLTSQTVNITLAGGSNATGFTVTGTGGAQPLGYSSANGAVGVSSTGSFNASVNDVLGNTSGTLTVQNTGNDGTGPSSAGSGQGSSQSPILIGVIGTVVTNRTVTASAVTGQRVIQGQTASGISTLNTSDPGNGDLTSASNTQFTVYNPTNGSSLALTGTVSNGPISVSTVASGPLGAGRIGTVALSASGGEGLAGETDTAPTVILAGNIVTNRVVISTSASFGLVHVGTLLSQGITLSTTGDDSQYTRVTVANGSDGFLTVSGGNNPTFNSPSVTDSRTLSGTAGTAGIFSSSVLLTTGSEGLAGESPINVPVNYSVQVFSGSGRWTDATVTSWGAGSNWTDANSSSVRAAPGIWGYNDTAVLDDTGGTKTITLDGASPTLAALTFSTSAGGYTLAQGSGGTLNLSNGTNSAVVTVSSGTQSITAPITLSSNSSFAPVAGSQLTLSGAIGGTGALLLSDAGALILSGSNSYTGGTEVDSGTLYIMNASALADGTSLTVGAGGTFIFDSTVSGSPSETTYDRTVSDSVIAPVPEPGTLVLLAAAFWSATACYRFSKRPDSRQTSSPAS